MRNILMMLLAALCAASCGGGTPEGIPAEGPMCVEQGSCVAACYAARNNCDFPCFDRVQDWSICNAICLPSGKACTDVCADVAERCAVLESPGDF